MYESLESIFMDDASEDTSFNIILIVVSSVIGLWITLTIAAMSPSIGGAGVIGAYDFGGIIGVVVGVFLPTHFGLGGFNLQVQRLI